MRSYYPMLSVVAAVAVLAIPAILIAWPSSAQPRSPDVEADGVASRELLAEVRQLRESLAELRGRIDELEQPPAAKLETASDDHPATVRAPLAAHPTRPATHDQFPQASPVQASPVQASPVQASPVQASQVQASPVQASPVQASPVQASPVQATPVQASPIQANSAPANAAPSVSSLAAVDSVAANGTFEPDSIIIPYPSAGTMLTAVPPRDVTTTATPPPPESPPVSDVQADVTTRPSAGATTAQPPQPKPGESAATSQANKKRSSRRPSSRTTHPTPMPRTPLATPPQFSPFGANPLDNWSDQPSFSLSITRPATGVVRHWEEFVATTQVPGWPVVMVRSETEGDHWWVQQLVARRGNVIAARVSFGNEDTIAGHQFEVVVLLLESSAESVRFRTARKFKELPEGVQRSVIYRYVRR